MTYDVSSGTLNLAQSLSQFRLHCYADTNILTYLLCRLVLGHRKLGDRQAYTLAHYDS